VRWASWSLTNACSLLTVTYWKVFDVQSRSSKHVRKRLRSRGHAETSEGAFWQAFCFSFAREAATLDETAATRVRQETYSMFLSKNNVSNDRVSDWQVPVTPYHLSIKPQNPIAPSFHVMSHASGTKRKRYICPMRSKRSKCRTYREIVYQKVK